MAPLKDAFDRELREYQSSLEDFRESLKRKDFPLILKPALEKISADTIRSGFRETGVFPHNPRPNSFKKIKKTAQSVEEEMEEALPAAVPVEVQHEKRDAKSRQLVKTIYVFNDGAQMVMHKPPNHGNITPPRRGVRMLLPRARTPTPAPVIEQVRLINFK